MEQTAELRQLGDSVEEILAALQDPEVFEAIFGEPSDEEIAEVLRQAAEDFHAGRHLESQDTPESTNEDDEPYRPRTKKEVLEGMALGFKQALAGIYRGSKAAAETVSSH